jgi:hypothetical protein
VCLAEALRPPSLQAPLAGGSHDRSRQLTVPFGIAQVLAQRKEDEGSGVIVNTMGWVDGEGYRLLVHSAKALRVNVVLVLGQDRLHSELDRDLAGSGVDVVKLAKSGGVVTRQREFRKVGAGFSSQITVAMGLG